MDQNERDGLRSRNDALREQVDSMLDKLDRQKRELSTVRTQLAVATSQAWSKDSLVRVVVNSAGVPVDVEVVAEAFKRATPERLGQAFVEAARSAARLAQAENQQSISSIMAATEDFPDLSDLTPGAPSLRDLLPELLEPATRFDDEPTVTDDDEGWGGPILREAHRER